MIATRKWHAKHPFAGQNTQQIFFKNYTNTALAKTKEMILILAMLYLLLIFQLFEIKAEQYFLLT